MKALETLISFIIVVIVIIAVSFAVSPNLRKGFMSVLKIGDYLTDEEKQLADNANSNFNSLNVKLNECHKNDENDCFCLKGGYIYPNGYHLQVYRNKNDIKVDLIGDSNNFIDSFSVKDAEGCVIWKPEGDNSLLDEGKEYFDKADLEFRARTKLSYKKEEFDANPSLLFYKINKRICVIDSAYSNVVSYQNVCLDKDKKQEVLQSIDKGTSVSLLKAADIYRDIGEYEKSIQLYQRIVNEFNDENSNRAKETLNILFKEKFNEFVINKETLSGIIYAEWIKENIFVPRLKENQLGDINDLKNYGWDDNEIEAYKTKLIAEGEKIWEEYYEVYNKPENKDFGLNFYSSEKDFLNEYIIGKALVPEYRLDDLTTDINKAENPLTG